MNPLRFTLACLLLVCCHSASAQKVTLVAVGDVCLAHGVEERMNQRGSGYPFAAMKAIWRKADIAFCNLECVLAKGGRKVPKKYNFRGDPRGAVALREGGFQIVSLANNHSMDYDRPALVEAMNALRANGVQYAGAGMTMAEARSVRIVTVRGLRVGFLAYLGLFPSILPIRPNEPSVAMAELAAIKNDVRATRPKVDFLIVSMHAGIEYTFRHSEKQEAIAHAAIDAGADMVIGHHPHVCQDSEVYRGKPIHYSLGNCIFDPSPTFLRHPEKPWSGMVVATLEKGKTIRSRLVPMRIVDRQPRLKNPKDSARMP